MIQILHFIIDTLALRYLKCIHSQKCLNRLPSFFEALNHMLSNITI